MFKLFAMIVLLSLADWSRHKILKIAYKAANYHKFKD
jgi:hypothetical protein